MRDPGHSTQIGALGHRATLYPGSVSLDEAVAAEEARVAAAFDASARNREAVDAAAARFAVLAVERGVGVQKLHGATGWRINLDGGRDVFVFADGEWVPYADAMVPALRRGADAADGTSPQIARAQRELADSVEKTQTARTQLEERKAAIIGVVHEQAPVVPDAVELEQAMARVLVAGARSA